MLANLSLNTPSTQRDSALSVLRYAELARLSAPTTEPAIAALTAAPKNENNLKDNREAWSKAFGAAPRMGDSVILRHIEETKAHRTLPQKNKADKPLSPALRAARAAFVKDPQPIMRTSLATTKRAADPVGDRCDQPSLADRTMRGRKESRWRIGRFLQG